jgi:hypothetical protein
MEISKQVFSRLKSFVTEFNKNKRTELEAKYKARLTKDAFARCIHYCRSNLTREHIHKEALDIFITYEQTPYRITIEGQENVHNYCLTNTLNDDDTIQVMSKRDVSGFVSVFLEDYDMKIDIKTEDPITGTKKLEVISALATMKKGYRYKKRFSYHTHDNAFRFDFTVVKRSRNVDREFVAHKDFASSSTSAAPEYFEAEIEVIKRGTTDGDKMATMFLSRMVELYSVANGIENLISKKEKNATIMNYMSLIKATANIDDVQKRPQRYFIGPQAITLEKKNIVEPGLGRTTILDGYTVTEKADGQRFILFIDAAGRVYLINNKLDVSFTGIESNTLKSCVFDGEYVTRDINNNRIKLYAIFDVYYYDGLDVKELPLATVKKTRGKVSSRLEHIKNFVDKMKAKFLKEGGMTLMCKNFEFGDGDAILKASQSILDQSKAGAFPYKIDGLIYTPMHLPVGGYFKKDSPSAQGAWEKLFKWKPAHDNTIDFLVKLEKDDKGKPMVSLQNNKVFRIFNLFVGYNPSRMDKISAKSFMERSFNRSRNYIARLFAPADVLDPSISQFYGQVDNAYEVVCANGEVIDDGAVVEFAYDNVQGIPYQNRWVPLRLRKDKVMGNDFAAAMNIWRSINDPVTEDMIKGEDKLMFKDLPEDNLYYNRNMARDKFATRNMMNFHNYWIKNQYLINTFKSNAKTLFDIACGKAGDLQKWLDAEIPVVVGVDYMRDNIENPIDGAYARLIDTERVPSTYKYLFLTMDASKRLNEGYINAMEDKNDAEIAKTLWGMGNKKSPYAGIASNGFDVVSCQFAVHYFFEKEETLDAFIDNVDANLVDGGHFIGTCLDGSKVKSLLKGTKKGDSITAKNEDRTMWDIRRMYDNEDAVKIGFGEHVEIYMESIGRVSKEYLVNMSTLINKLGQRNIHVEAIKSFQEVHAEISAKDESTVNKYYMDSVNNMTPEEKRYSFMNVMFIFKKGGRPTPPPQVKKVVKKKTKAT